MKKLFILLLIVSFPFMLESCLDTENSTVVTGMIDLRAGVLPDTVDLYTSIPISLRASVPNSCWHSIFIYKEVVKDTVVGFFAKATYENHGERCVEIVKTKDTVINFQVTLKKTYIFHFIESYDKERIDTVVVR